MIKKFNLNKNKLEKLYCNKKLSMKKIGKIYNKSPQTIMRLIHENKITINKYIKAWNSEKTSKDDPRILAGKTHPRLKNKIYYTAEFKRLRKEILPCRCNLCKKDANVIHHKDRNKMNNKKENLIPLCVGCHTTIHNKERGITIYKHNCEWCGKEFIIYHKKECKQRFCSLKCKSLYKYHKEKHPLKKKNDGKMFNVSKI